jgi:hypothetical protein
MSKEKPDYDDANLTLRLYKLRRDSVMRQARAAMLAWVPTSYEDVLALTQPTHPDNAAWRQVSSYWEMVYGMGRHGIAHPEYLVENNAEGLILFTKIQPYLERLRKEVSPTALMSAEWAAKETAVGRQRMALFQKRVQAMLEAARR